MSDHWKLYTEIDFSDKEIKWYNIDTRDFHCSFSYKPIEMQYKLPIGCNKHPERWLHTTEEIKALLDRYYQESGGPGEWRMFALDGEGKKYTMGWEMKYITIIRHGKGLLVYIRSGPEGLFPLKKTILQSPVHQKYLNHH